MTAVRARVEIAADRGPQAVETARHSAMTAAQVATVAGPVVKVDRVTTGDVGRTRRATGALTAEHVPYTRRFNKPRR
jgi:hypothetical protein